MREYDVSSLDKHWESLVFQLCSILAVYNLLTDEPEEEKVEALDSTELFEETYKVYMRAVHATEQTMQDEEVEKGEVN